MVELGRGNKHVDVVAFSMAARIRMAMGAAVADPADHLGDPDMLNGPAVTMTAPNDPALH